MGQYFRLNGLTGFLIAVALLLSILAFLTINAIAVQQAAASDFYKIENPIEVKMFNSDSASTKEAFIKPVKLGE